MTITPRRLSSPHGRPDSAATAEAQHTQCIPSQRRTGWLSGRNNRCRNAASKVSLASYGCPATPKLKTTGTDHRAHMEARGSPSPCDVTDITGSPQNVPVCAHKQVTKKLPFVNKVGLSKKRETEKRNVACL